MPAIAFNQILHEEVLNGRRAGKARQAFEDSRMPRSHTWIGRPPEQHIPKPRKFVRQNRRDGGCPGDRFGEGGVVKILETFLIFRGPNAKRGVRN